MKSWERDDLAKLMADAMERAGYGKAALAREPLSEIVERLAYHALRAIEDRIEVKP